MTEPHERPEFRNSTSYTVAITYTVAGGERPSTAERRAAKVAEQLTNAASRLGQVVKVTAKAGFDINGEIADPRPVYFSAANGGRGALGDPGKLGRYLDPDHERALTSLAQANAEYRARKDADRDRRWAVSCTNPYGSSAFLDPTPCECVYCRPQEHWWAVEGEREAPGHTSNEHRCLCGQRVTVMGERCTRHRDTALVVLDGDPKRLQLLAREHRTSHHHDRQHHGRDRTSNATPERRTRVQLDDPNHGLEL